MKKQILFAAILALVASCKEKDMYVDPREAVANTFDFSTVQDINLQVDYSAFETHGPVFFSVYSENPFEGEGESMKLKTDIKPIFEAYTNKEGKFNDQVRLANYAKNLYVVTGNFFIAETMMNVQVNNGEAIAVAENAGEEAAAARRSAPRRIESAPTNSLSTLYQLYNEVDVKTGDDTGRQVYKPWRTWLGTWDNMSGRPNYILDRNSTDERLIFSDEELEGLYETVANALVANQTCREEYRTQADLTVEKESEVSVTFLGSMTCWNNTLGYYYYNEADKPASVHDVNIVMLVPNTQDGKWWRNWCKTPKFYGNIGMNRGDAIQLMYYPNIANGDMTGATTLFPKGTKIGFILKSNGWGMQKSQGDKKFFNSYNGNVEGKLARQYNVWASSTDGLSYCNTAGLNPSDCEKQNPDGQSRSAKFAYRNANGEEYAIVGFEDACNDLDYDDVVLALKPADAFSKLPVVEDKKTSSSGIYAFEDKWPDKGDYDLNDAVIEVTHEKAYSVTTGGTDYKINQEVFSLTTYQNFVTLKSGLALTLETKEAVSDIKMKKIAPESNDTVEAAFTVDGKTYLLTEDISAELGTTYILEVNYKRGFTKLTNTAVIKPFLYRPEENNKRWEVHIPFEAPTNRMNTTYFGTEDDKSVPAEGKYFVRYSDFPFAFYLDGVSIASFQNTLLNREYERVMINNLYPTFLRWVRSNGAECADWYLHPFNAE